LREGLLFVKLFVRREKKYGELIITCTNFIT